METLSSICVRITDYKRFIFKKHGLNVNEKINVRANILYNSSPITDRLIIRR